MIKKIVVGAIAAGAISVPLAGVAAADHGTTTGADQTGPGRVFDLPDGYTTPGQLFRALRDEGRAAGYRNLPQYLRSGESAYGEVRSPGQLLKQFRVDTPPGDDDGGSDDGGDGGTDDGGDS